MTKFLFEGTGTVKGAQRLAREGGTARRAALEKMVESLGGKLDAFYYADGDVDAYAIVDLPDMTAAVTIARAVNEDGGGTVKTVMLVPPEKRLRKAG